MWERVVVRAMYAERSGSALSRLESKAREEREMTMPQLVGLPDTKQARDAEFITSASQVPGVLRRGNAATAAGDTGAINVWVDDNRKYRCELTRYMVRCDSQTYTNLSDVKQWVRETLPAIQ